MVSSDWPWPDKWELGGTVKPFAPLWARETFESTWHISRYETHGQAMLAFDIAKRSGMFTMLSVICLDNAVIERCKSWRDDSARMDWQFVHWKAK